MDLEAITCSWLQSVSALGQVGTRTPADTDSAPWTCITLLNDIPKASSSALWAVDAYLQLDLYAAGDNNQAQARDLADAVRARLAAMPGLHAGIVVSAVTDMRIRRLPDTELVPARERYILTATVTAHPAA